jgi:bacteriorhodopsin
MVTLSDTFITNSFLFAYLALFGLTLITFIEALKTSNMRIRHILNLETSVSLIAGFVYSIFYDMLSHNRLKLEKVTEYRYMDWAITTPMLLLVFMLFLNFENKVEVHFTRYIIVIIFNYIMLTAGYLGETKQIKKNKGGIIGFIAYFTMIAIIWYYFIHNKPYILHNIILFVIFTSVWALYGVAYYLNTKPKNIMYNGLDVISKAMFGIFIWLYYGHVVSF